MLVGMGVVGYPMPWSDCTCIFQGVEIMIGGAKANFHQGGATAVCDFGGSVIDQYYSMGSVDGRFL